MPLAAGPGRRALVVGLLVVLLATSVAGAVLRSAYRSERAAALDGLQAEVRAEAAVAEQLVADHLKVLVALASSDEVRSGDPDRIQELIVRFDPIARGFTGGMGWVDAAGVSQASAIAGPRSGVSFAERDYFQVARAGTPTIGAVSLSMVADQVIVPFAVPSTDASGVRNGVLVAAVRLDADGELARALRLFDAEDYFVDREGLVVSGRPARAAPAAAGSWPPDPPGTAPPAVAARTDAFGRTGRSIAWAEVPTAGWTAVRSRPEGEVFASAHRVAVLGTLGIVGGAFTSLLVAVAVARRAQRVADAAAQAARTNRRSEALASALAEMVSSTTTAEIAQALVTRALPTLGASGATLLVPAQERLRVLHTTGAAHADARGAPEHERGDPAAALAFGAWDTARPVVQQPGTDRTPPEHAVVALPLVSGDAVLGVVEITWPGPLDAADVAMLDVLASRAATAVQRAETHEAEHRAVVVFQQSVLPRAPESIAGVEVEACYIPADERFGAGGDWYDAVAVDDRRLLLVIGDVVGHGVESAGTMGRLSTTAHTLARHGTHRPVDILRALDALAHEHPDAVCAAVVCLLVDLDSRTCTYAIAGHLPPLALDDTGAVVVLDEQAGGVIGVDEHRREAVRSLDGIERLVLCTDGVVDRSEPIDEALGRLAQVALAIHDRPPGAGAFSERFRDQALGDVTRHDDVAVITARLHPITAAASPRTMRFAAATTAPAQARRFVRAVLGDAGLDHLAEDAELLVSELVANAVEHARSDGEVAVHLHEHRVRVEVADSRPGQLAARPAEPTATSGRGLWIVDRTATRWGVEVSSAEPPGKRVWFELEHLGRGASRSSGGSVEI